jgi:hypothetical protein
MTNERRSLVDGLSVAAKADSELEKKFVFGELSKSPHGAAKPNVAPPTMAAPQVPKAPLSTRIRADFVTALKRASLERQLAGLEPSTLQDMLEQAIEPWLRDHGYLS